MNNIIFDSIEINNFLSIGHAEVDLNDQGFVLVKGINKEGSTVQSNGSGKSSIFDAIFWTLTGETLRGASDVVNENRQSEGCSCHLRFHSDEDSYLIVRYKSHPEYGNSCHFYVNDSILTDQTKKSQEMINKTIPSVSSSEILGSIILLGQGLPYKFSSYGPSKRKDLLETMSGSSSQINSVKYKLETKEAIHKSTVNDYLSENSKYEGLITGYQKAIDILKNNLENVKSPEIIAEMVSSLSSQIESYESSILSINLEIKNENESLERLNEYCSSLSVNRNSISLRIMEIKNKLQSIKSGNCPTCGRPYEITQEMLEEQDKLKSELKELQSQDDMMTSKINAFNKMISESNTKVSTLSNEIMSYKYKIKSCQEEVKELEKSSVQSQDLSNQIEETSRNIDTLKVKINENLDKIESEQEVIDCIGYLKRQLSRDFKGYMLDEVIKFMSSRSEYYSNYLFTTDSKVKITLSGNKILISVGDRLYENLSGGERQRVDLAVQFALRDMLMTTSGFSCNLLVLDEAFDNLDAQGSDSLINLVVSEFSDINSIYIVTHHAEIDVPYDQQIEVIKGSDGVSYLR